MPLVRGWGDMNPISMIDGYTSPFGDAAASRGGRKKRRTTMAKRRGRRSLMRKCAREAKHKVGSKYRSALKKCLKKGFTRRRRRR
jgi:hypothetical protein